MMKLSLLYTFSECLTYGGPSDWINAPNECQFPFYYNGKVHDKCITHGKSQPWCPTIVKKESKNIKSYLQSYV